MRELERRTGKGFGAIDRPAARLGSQRRARLDARHDGHDPQPRPQRRDGRRLARLTEQRSLRLGRVPPVHHDVLERRLGIGKEHFEELHRRVRSSALGVKTDPEIDAASWQRARRSSSRRSSRSIREPRVSAGRARAARARDRGGLRFVELQARDRLSPFQQDPRRLGAPPSTSMEMVFGNMGDDSGTGVAFTRDPNTGEHVLFGEYLHNAQGEDVVAGIRTPEKIADLASTPARGLRAVRRDRAAPRAALSRRAGSRVYGRARQALHAADAQRQAQRRGGRARSRSISSTKG